MKGDISKRIMDADDFLLSKIKTYQPVFWRNPSKEKVAKALKHIPLGLMDIQDAEKRLHRFAPAIKQLFPETDNGIIESSHVKLRHAEELHGKTLEDFTGPVYAKLDNYLPISGSVKARGGIYEVLWFAEQVALQEGIITLDSDYRALLTTEARKVFSGYSLVVGSTGNLGLSIGIMGRAFGFNVEVHMSKEAAAWKKERLRSLGAHVVEHEGDYSSAVAEARQIASSNPKAHFVDDEESVILFLGYAVAGLRLAPLVRPFLDKTDKNLKVYIPCGVGGAPGGIAFGLKATLGDRVEVYFAEPTHSPCMLLALATGKLSDISVGDVGLDGVTVADGLAVGRASKLTTPWMMHLINGAFTVPDEFMLDMVRWLWEKQSIKTEPSANAGLYGMAGDGIHMVWLTGGSMVPEDVFDDYLSKSQPI